MIAPKSINLAMLPSVALCDRAMLPTTPCIYFAIDSQGVVQYIGRSVNPVKRWANHHKQQALTSCVDIKIAYLSVEADLLYSVELALIKWFNPPLNYSDTTGYKLAADPGYIPSAKVLEAICEAYRVQPGELLEWIPSEKVSTNA